MNRFPDGCGSSETLLETLLAAGSAILPPGVARSPYGVFPLSSEKFEVGELGDKGEAKTSSGSSWGVGAEEPQVLSMRQGVVSAVGLVHECVGEGFLGTDEQAVNAAGLSGALWCPSWYSMPS